MENTLPFHTWKHNNWVNPFSIKQIQNIQPKIVYDVGIGDGFYGQLLRYLGFNDSKIIGVELNPRWCEHCMRLNVYDDIFNESIHLFIDKDIEGDLIIFGDILEHLDKSDMTLTLATAVKKFNYVLLNGPIGFQPQDHEDKEEIHRCGITRYEDLDTYDIVEYNELPNVMMNCLIRGTRGVI